MYELISSTNNIPKWEELLSKNNSTLKIDYLDNIFEAHDLYYLP